MSETVIVGTVYNGVKTEIVTEDFTAPAIRTRKANFYTFRYEGYRTLDVEGRFTADDVEYEVLQCVVNENSVSLVTAVRE